MRRVVEGATVPVLILGGERRDDDTAVVQQVCEALSAGVAGVAFGRSLWAHPQPAAIALRIVEAVHGRERVSV
jgi:DhnA family fructose-bisphosphate aldolase class Ia